MYDPFMRYSHVKIFNLGDIGYRLTIYIYRLTSGGPAELSSGSGPLYLLNGSFATSSVLILNCVSVGYYSSLNVVPWLRFIYLTRTLTVHFDLYC